MLFRPTGRRGGMSDESLAPGDLLAQGFSQPSALTTAGAGTLTAALIASGIVVRTGPVGGYTDTPDTAQNILNALGGNFGFNPNNTAAQGGVPQVDSLSGICFDFWFQNAVAQAMTFGTSVEGIEYGSNLNVAASLVRLYKVYIKNTTPRQSLIAAQTNASPTITLATPVAMGVITPGMLATGTNIAAASYVLGITQGVGNSITGVTLAANATATIAANTITFSPVVRFEGIGTMTA